MEIYYQTMRVITKGIFKSLFSCIIVWLGITLENLVVKSVLIMCANASIQQCHSIITGMTINYEKQVVITGIKLGMQCLIC